eukprot:CAMPEP_0184377080 /NCGR_PEP_ID=MMETSP0007-20130409/1968_1 /TAXON_ID=97485 /ORGANISM="Prymnesium parvum, Strain Texoma1" /LENGTH=50 /DNA_ID=CAMNT_0026720841 /DNA_START=188 /DNA_END=337 /DNA_ORIENTATION=+
MSDFANLAPADLSYLLRQLPSVCRLRFQAGCAPPSPSRGRGSSGRLAKLG